MTVKTRLPKKLFQTQNGVVSINAGIRVEESAHWILVGNFKQLLEIIRFVGSDVSTRSGRKSYTELK